MNLSVRRIILLLSAGLMSLCFGIANSHAASGSAISWSITVSVVGGGSVTVDPAYYEDFEESAYGAGAGGWWTVDNSNMVADGLGSVKIAIVNSPQGYCQANSNSDLSLNFDDNPYLHLVITAVDLSTGNLIYIRDYPGGVASPTRKLIASYLGAGTYDIDMNASDPWTGTHQFAIEIVIEAASGNDGAGTTLDMIQMYNGNTSTYVEHFEETAYGGAGAGGWWDYGNAVMTATGNGAVRLETAAADPTYCTVASNNDQTVDLDTYHFLRIVLPVVDSGIGNKVELVEQGTGDTKTIATNLGAGINTDIDFSAALGDWNGGGARTFSVHLVIETTGVLGAGMEIDEIKIGPEGQ